MRPGEDETRSWRMADPNEVLPGPGRESSGDRPQTASDPQATRISSVRAVIPLGPVSEEKVRKSTEARVVPHPSPAHGQGRLDRQGPSARGRGNAVRLAPADLSARVDHEQ